MTCPPVLAGAAAGGAAGATPAGRGAGSIWAMTSLTRALSPFFLRILVTIPATGAGTSKAAFSVSITTMFWSTSTHVPSLTCHCPMKASVIESPALGSRMSTAMICLSEECEVVCVCVCWASPRREPVCLCQRSCSMNVTPRLTPVCDQSPESLRQNVFLFFVMHVV